MNKQINDAIHLFCTLEPTSLWFCDFILFYFSLRFVLILLSKRISLLLICFHKNKLHKIKNKKRRIVSFVIRHYRGRRRRRHHHRLCFRSSLDSTIDYFIFVSHETTLLAPHRSLSLSNNSHLGDFFKWNKKRSRKSSLDVIWPHKNYQIHSNITNAIGIQTNVYISNDNDTAVKCFCCYFAFCYKYK